MPEIGRWLKTFMCEQYANLFEAYGFKTLHSVCQLQSSTLHSMGISPEHCDKILENVSVLRQSLAVSSPENGVSQDASLVYNIRQNMQAPRYSGSLGASYPEHGYDHQLGSAGQANAYAYHSSSAYSQQYNGPNGQVSHNMSYPTNEAYSGSGQPHYGTNQDVYGQSMYNNHLHSNPGSWEDPMLLYNHSPRHVMGSSPPATPSPMMRSPPPPTSGPTMVMSHYSRHIMMEQSGTTHHHPAWAHSQGLSPGMVSSPRATPSPGMSTLGGIVAPAVCSPGQGKTFSSPPFAPHPPPAHQQPVSYEYSSGPNPPHSRSNIVTPGRQMSASSVNNANAGTGANSSTPSSDPLQSLQKMVMLEPQNMSNSRPTSVSPGNGQVSNKAGSKFSSVEHLAGCGTPSPSPSYTSQKSKTPEATSPSVVSGDSQGKSSITGMSPPYSPTPSMHTNTTSSETKHSTLNNKKDTGEVCKPTLIKSSPVSVAGAGAGKMMKPEKCTDAEREASKQKMECPEKDAVDSISSDSNSLTLKKKVDPFRENGHITKEEGEHLLESSVRLKQVLKEESATAVAPCPVGLLNGPARVSTGAFREYKERHGSRKFPSHSWDDPNARINRRKKWKEQYERPQMYHGYPLSVEMNGVAVNPPYNPRTDISLMNKTETAAAERLDAKGYCDKSYYVDRSYGDARFGGYNDEQPVSLTNYNRFSNYGRNDLQPYGSNPQVQLPNNVGSGGVVVGGGGGGSGIGGAQSRLPSVTRANEKLDNSGGVTYSGIESNNESIGGGNLSEVRPRASTSQDSFTTDNTTCGGDSSGMSSSVKKKRGRPLGSKNKPKPPGFEKEPRKKKQKSTSKGDSGGNVTVGDVFDSDFGNGNGEVTESVKVAEIQKGGGGVGGGGGVIVSAVGENVDACAKKQKVVTVVTQPTVSLTNLSEQTPALPVQVKKSSGDYKLRGPYVHVSRSGKHGMEISVVNTTTKDEETDSKNKNNRRVFVHGDSRVHRKLMTVGFVSTLSANYDVFTKDQSWVCHFCRKGSHFRGLGDLYGPYFVDNLSAADFSSDEVVEEAAAAAATTAAAAVDTVNNSAETQKAPSDQATDKTAKVKRKRTEIIEEFMKANKLKQDRSVRTTCTALSLTTTTTSPNQCKGLASPTAGTNNVSAELWVHEDCIVWCHGVYLTGNKIVGLKEAMRIASQFCTSCNEPGATLGCLQKGCSEQFHYLCATDKGCELKKELFCMLCPKHKRQP